MVRVVPRLVVAVVAAWLLLPGQAHAECYETQYGTRCEDGEITNSSIVVGLLITAGLIAFGLWDDQQKKRIKAERDAERRADWERRGAALAAEELAKQRAAPAARVQTQAQAQQRASQGAKAQTPAQQLAAQAAQVQAQAQQRVAQAVQAQKRASQAARAEERAQKRAPQATQVQQPAAQAAQTPAEQLAAQAAQTQAQQRVAQAAHAQKRASQAVRAEERAQKRASQTAQAQKRASQVVQQVPCTGLRSFDEVLIEGERVGVVRVVQLGGDAVAVTAGDGRRWTLRGAVLAWKA
jgi:FtsZ-interacting cell division protein ZipA